MFVYNENCICGEKYTLSHAERCFGTHRPMEVIAEEEHDSIERYIAEMWTYMLTS